MSKLPLDLKHFKKVRSDDKTSTFQHYAGHTITVAHGKLSSKMREQLHKLPIVKAKKMAEGGEVDSSDGSIPQPSADVPRSGASGSWAPPNQQDFTPSAPQTPGQSEGMLQGPAQPAAPKDPYNVMGSMEQQLKGMKSVGTGQQAEQKTMGELGKAQLAKEQAFQTQAQQQLDNYNKAAEPYLAERRALMSDIGNGHINPNAYIEKMSTGDKVLNGIGLVLSGIGAGLTHGPNLAFQYLQDQINRDIDAQKADLGKKENLLSHNLRATGDLREAYNMTKLQQNDILSSQLRMAADEAADPLAKARAMQMAGMTDQNTAQLQHQMALQKMMMGGSNGPDPAKMVPMLVPKEHQAKAFSEIEAAENTRKMSGSILQSFEDAAKTNTVARTGAGLLRTPAEVYALHQAMQPTFKDLEGTVRQAAMDNTFKNITPSPGDLPSTIETKRQALRDYLQSKLSAPTARAYGIDLGSFGRTAPVAGSQPPKINFKPIETK